MLKEDQIMNDIPTVSIVLPTYNRAYCIAHAIEAIRAQTFTDWELIVCDDCSTDTTGNVVKSIRLDDSRIVYHRNLRRLGLPGNRNSGIALARARLIYFIEDDVVLDPCALGKLLCGYKQMKVKGVKVGAIGPRTVEPPKKGRLLLLERKTAQRARRSMDKPSLIDKWTGLMFQNFAMEGTGLKRTALVPSWSLFDREALQEVGGYEGKAYNKFNFSHEETDLFVRLQKAGYKLYFHPGALAHHKHEPRGGTRTSPLKYYYYYLGAHIVFLVRNFNWAAAYMIPACIAYLTYSVLRASPAIITGNET
jgi:glycosyltransferase involved in cell wall biosynthesis